MEQQNSTSNVQVSTKRICFACGAEHVASQDKCRICGSTHLAEVMPAQAPNKASPMNHRDFGIKEMRTILFTQIPFLHKVKECGEQSVATLARLGECLCNVLWEFRVLLFVLAIIALLFCAYLFAVAAIVHGSMHGMTGH